MGASISGLFFIDCLLFNTHPDPNVCHRQLNACYVFEALCYLFSYYLLFFRKFIVVPSELFDKPGALDFFIMLICMGCSLALNVPCIYGDIVTCFNQDIYQAGACCLSFLYFEILFLVQVAGKTFEASSNSRKSTSRTTGRQKIEILQMCVLTGSIALVYLFGSLSYKSWGGNFYTNAMWNMGWCVLPLFCIQTVMSRRFMDLFKETGLVNQDSALATNNSSAGKLTIRASVRSMNSFSSSRRASSSAVNGATGRESTRESTRGRDIITNAVKISSSHLNVAGIGRRHSSR
ncbi:hypothetical protein BDR26DRAFT_872383 [Obelidium mucronatum]|nr:hypothetical protein BDR26DRAFT_872383 [Obelidium mucronatum]